MVIRPPSGPLAVALAPAGPWRPVLLRLGVARVAGEDLAPPGALPSRVANPTNALLLRRPGRVVLVDSGYGVFAEPAADRLGRALAAAGAARADIDDIMLTHLHDDHIGALVSGQWPDRVSRAFPRASVHAAPDALAGLAAYGPAARRIARVAGVTAAAGEIAPGLSLRAAPGHAPGHSIVLVGDDLVHLADVVHAEPHVAHPAWDGTWDADREQALETRLSVLAELASCGVRVVGSHLEAEGRVVAHGDALRWTPDSSA
jgi:glyoxylase-like metal-dependent hydrolase (beta-lactamase superfamily II)